MNIYSSISVVYFTNLKYEMPTCEPASAMFPGYCGYSEDVVRSDQPTFLLFDVANEATYHA